MATTTVTSTTSTSQDVVLHFGPEVTRSQSTSSTAKRDQWRSRKTKNKKKDKDKDGALGNRVHDIPEWRKMSVKILRKKHVRHPATHPRKFFTRIRNSTGERSGIGKTQCLYSLPKGLDLRNTTEDQNHKVSLQETQ